MNELKVMAIKAKSRLLNKGLRDVYTNSIYTEVKRNNSCKIISDINPSLDINDENTRKRYLLNIIKNKIQ